MKIDRKNPRHWRLVALQAAYSLIAVLYRLICRKPDKPLVILYGHQLSGNLKALYDEWAGTGTYGFDMCFLSLDPDHADTLERMSVCVLRCSKLRDMLRLSETSVMITDHGLHMMKPLLQFTDIRFIDVWHGIPFKGFTPEDFRLQHRYDEIWVSSPLLKSLYVERFGFEADRVVSIGYARSDRLMGHSRAKSEFRRTLELPERTKVVLYAPTWQQDDAARSIFPFTPNAAEFIQRLAKVCSEHDAILAIRAHLNTSDIPLREKDVVLCAQREFPDTEDVLAGTDLLICDWSSIAFDFLVTRRPAIFLDVPAPFKSGFSLGPEYRYGAIAGNMESLEASLSDYLADSGRFIRDYGEKLEMITHQVFGQSLDGESARRQLVRLQNAA